MVRLTFFHFFLLPEVFPPNILEFHKRTVYNEKAVDLYCNISAHPVPTVRWYKDGYSLESKIEELDRWKSCNGLVQHFYRVKSDIGRLVICKPEHVCHTGFYTCIVTNRRGQSNATAFLDVLGKITFFFV